MARKWAKEVLDLLAHLPKGVHAELVGRTEACDGAWWGRTQRKCSRSGVYLIAYVLYLDGTWLTKSGARKSKPLCISVANLPGKAFRKNAAKRIICQVPDFPCTKKDFGKEEAKAANRAQYHDIIHQVCFCACEMRVPAAARMRAVRAHAPTALHFTQLRALNATMRAHAGACFASPP